MLNIKMLNAPAKAVEPKILPVAKKYHTAATEDVSYQSMEAYIRSLNPTEIFGVHANKNGYLYLPLMVKGAITGLYFSEKAAGNVAVGEPARNFRHMQVAFCKNAQGESRVKICAKSESISLDEMFA